MFAYDSTKMAHHLVVNCNLTHEFLNCTLPEGTIVVDLKVRILRGIILTKGLLKKAEIRPFPNLKKIKVQFLN